MRFNNLIAKLKTAVLVTGVLLLGASSAVAQQQVNLTAAPTTLTMPDGSSVPMWGYSCGAVVAGSTATCAKLNPAATGWSPVVITVPTGQGLTVNLTNSLVFGTNGVPTSLTIVGQLGGGLGNVAQRTTTPSPLHDNQGTTWPIANGGPVFTPPAQLPRVESFSTQVAAGGPATPLTWTAANLRPGTYLMESGTHPSIQGPMGLYGIVVVTSAPVGATAGTAYPGVTYAADVSMLLSEIDPAQNKGVTAAVNTVGFSESATIAPYLGGPISSLNLTSGGSGYTSAPTVHFSSGAATATAVVDTDPTSSTYRQVIELDINNGGTYAAAPVVSFTGGGGSGAHATAALQLQANGITHCSGGAAACYPPVVNYTPLYYLFNGVAFDKTKASTSLFPVPSATAAVGSRLLVRLVNAGVRMHVPSMVGEQTNDSSTGTLKVVPGFSLIAEDGNPLPGNPRVQSEVFMAAGKTYDVMINAPAAGTAALPIFDRELSLSGNATSRDAGMLAYISVNGNGLPAAPAITGAIARADTYTSVVPGNTLTISDPSKGVVANDTNVYGVKVLTAPTKGALTLNPDGTFSYIPNTGWSGGDSFVYQANGSGPTATVTLSAAAIEAGSGIVMGNATYNSNVATALTISSPGILLADKDTAGYPLTVAAGTVTPSGSGWTLSVDKSGGFTAVVPGPGTYTFSYKAQNSQKTVSATTATVTLNFPVGTGLNVKVLDGKDKITTLSDYRWIIEEDRTFFIDPTKTTNTGGTTAATVVPTFGTNFHTSYMPVVAEGCVGAVSCESGQTVLGQPAVCDQGDGACRTTATQQTAVDPSQVHLDPTKRYYISILPGDGANPFNAGNGSACLAANDPNYDPSSCGHGMGGAPIAAGQTAVTVLVEPTPFQTANLSIFVFEDDFPLNGENDAGGGALGGGDVGLAANEPGLGGFDINLFDDAGGTGDATGQMTYDMFNMPLSNSLAGTIDPISGLDACPLSQQSSSDPAQKGITGRIVTCPNYEADGKTYSPLAGQALVANLMPGRYGVVATPAADRIAKGEEWLQTNTLDGQKAHDSFLRIGEPSYFQEFGPAGYHVSIGFANPKIINDRLASVCAGTTCGSSVTGTVTTERMSRTPDERLYSSGSNDSFSFTQCYVSIGDPDGEDFAFTKCDSDGKFTLSNLPSGNWRITVFDQWNDMLVDGLSTPVLLSGGALDMGDIAMNQWQANIYTSTFFDQDGNGVRGPNEPGLTFVPTNIRFRDGSYSNFNSTDLAGNAGFNEVFPLFSWYVIETDSTRYKNTGTHVIYDAGGPADGSLSCGQPGYPACGTSSIAQFMANTAEPASVGLPTPLRVPGAVYCSNADCNGFSILNGPGSSATGSTGRIDPPWVTSEGWQGFSGQNSFIEFGKKPFAAGENGGIHGHVIYASTRPFDDPTLLLQLSWEPMVPHVTINLYQEGTAADGTQTLKLVDTTVTSSWDDWAQGFRSDGVPNMNCPGQATSDLFFFSLYNQPDYLDAYYNGGTPAHTLPNNSQFKCYDGMHNWNQVQPAPYDGMYRFPSILGRNPATGATTGSNCTICSPNPTDGTPMLPDGKYVVEVVVPPGYELVKEEDKNILIGDNYIAPVTQQFAGLGNVFILPDQAEVGAAYNSNNPQNSTQDLGRTTFASHEGDTGSVETFWPCVGESRIVPDFISLYPQSQEVAPFAGATRNLCDRKEVSLDDQTSVLAKFYVFTSTHAAAHFTGVITDDFTSEFDPFSPQFGEKFSPPDMPISIKDFSGNEIARTYTDHWGAYNGLNYSTWEVNPPNPTGYAPTMMVVCMNDPGNGPTPDPLFNPAYSQFCYEIPFMPGQTQYMDTPVTPTSAYAGAGYNNPDCAYPDTTPAIKSVIGNDTVGTVSGSSGKGPWVSGSGTGHTVTITALGDQIVNNYGYSGPSQTAAPYNAKTVTRHYGFGTTRGTVTVGSVTVPAGNITTWNDTTITFTVPSGVAACTKQQQLQYGGTSANTLCGEVIVTAANGKQSIDTVTLTIGGKAPTVLGAGQTIQSAIDAAKPGDMIIVPPGVYTELVLMWKPVRLQGVGAASSLINANTQPAGKLDPWRRQVLCLFGLGLNARPITNGANGNPFDSTATFSCPTSMRFQVDRIPLEPTVGWDASLNGNLAEQLQEPSLMGAYEGAGITVLAKGVRFPTTAGTDPFGSDTFPDGTVLLTSSTSSTNGCGANTSTAHNPFPSNFQCNPSRIDGLSITDSSQGGGGIFVHGWAHNLEISNNRIYNNSGTLSGGISVGQGEFPDPYMLNGTTPNAAPGSCQNTGTTNTQLPYCINLNVNVHHNAVTLNSSLGDELFSSTPSGAGGVAFCTGADFYKFNYNWVCGNLSTGDGGGVAHLGFIYNGDIEHNSILFNQSTNPTVPTNGGGLAVLGAPDTDPVCGADVGATADADCAPGTSDGTGPGLIINANLIMGNSAESGSGGGIRLHAVNGTELTFFPLTSSRWYQVNITNNIIANNVAGWDGAGVSLQDALYVNLINNTIISNDTTASAGVLFNTLGAPLSSSPAPTSSLTSTSTSSAPQAAGVVAIPNSPTLLATLGTLSLSCPTGHANCKQISNPLLDNNVLWENRSFYIGVGALSPAYQQNIVSLYNSFSNALAANQSQTDATAANAFGGVHISGGTGACPSAASYWDIGVRGDLGPSNHASGFTLAPAYSIMTSAAGYASTNLSGDPSVVSQYCNGSRVPPELGAAGWQVPPGIADATVPNPLFSLQPSATVDEGNNWINISWGPLSLTNPTVTGAATGNYGGGAGLGNYALAAATSPAVDLIPSSANGTNGAYTLAPANDFFNNPRKSNSFVDAGAVEFAGTATGPVVSVVGGPLAFGDIPVNTTSPAQTLTVRNTGSATATGITIGAFPARFSRPAGTAGGTCSAAAFNLAVGANCTINVVFAPGTTLGAANGTLAINYSGGVTGSPVSLSGNGVPQTFLATVTPTTLAFGNWATGTTSSAKTVTVTNTGNTALAGGVFTVVGGAPFARPAGTAGGTCTATLAVGASCTISLTFAPTTATAYSRTLTIAYTGATVTGTPVTLTGAGVAARAPLTVTPSPLTITLPTGTVSGSGTVTLTNTAAAGGAQVVVTNVRIAGGNILTWFFNGPVTDNCTGAALAPGASCTVDVRFTNVLSPRGTNRNGTVTFTDNGSTATQTGNLIGFATP